ncbi:GNAT family N-acetyltransferase [Streptococcus merionis]|uniref:GNAT family N-acetyltransferase n=1 Tax=Streptococcus merionis TaxID=400065 RepID=UPI0035113127
MIQIYRDDTILPILDDVASLYGQVFEKETDFFKLRVKNSIDQRKNPVVIGKYRDGILVAGLFGFDFCPDNWWAQQIDAYLPAGKNWYANSFELNELFVAKDCQSQGLGKALLQELHQLVAPKNILLSTCEENSRAIKLYKHLGYRVFSDKFDFPGKEELYLLMVREGIHDEDSRKN